MIARDKKLHFFVCLVASIFSPLFALGLAFGKEYGDSKAINNYWDWSDILADVLGTIFGTVLHIIILNLLISYLL